MYRINKCIVGYSRRQADELVKHGRLKVNGEVIREPGVRLSAGDHLYLDNQPVPWESHVSQVYADISTIDSELGLFHPKDGFLYLKVWKPKGVVVTTWKHDPNNIIQWIQNHPTKRLPVHSSTTVNTRLFPVGRLDKDTTGLLLLTSNPRFQHELLHSSMRKATETSDSEEEDDVDYDLLEETSLLHPLRDGRGRGGPKTTREFSQPKIKPSILYQKVYQVTLDAQVSDLALSNWRTGMPITTYSTARKRIVQPTAPCNVTPLASEHANGRYVYEIVLQEGRNRQLRRMAHAFGYDVVDIHRTNLAHVSLNGLRQPGDWQMLTKEELKTFSKLVLEQHLHH